MILIEKKKIESLKADWTRLTASNHNASPFHEYDFACILKKAYNYHPYRVEKPEFYVASEDGEIQMIAPLCRHKSRDGDYYVSFGAMFRVCFEDFIYSDSLSEEKLKEYLSLLLDYLKQKIIFDFVSEGSLLFKVLNGKYELTRDELCVGITLPRTYSEYFYHSIKHHLRQNIRRSYKALEADNMVCTYRFELNGNIDKHSNRDFLDVYLKRHGYKGRNPIKRIKRNWFNRYHHHNAVAIPKLSSGFLAELYINGKIAAAFGGYIQKNKQYIILHRGAINETYKKYSPGILLLTEIIRKAIEEYRIPFLDLSKGNENYKYILGGQNFYQHCYCIE